MLEDVDLTQRLDSLTYRSELDELQGRLNRLSLQVYCNKLPVVIAFEGWDAAGKGGTIRRLSEKLDPHVYKVVPIAAPEGEDKQHHYLHRFWRRLPPRGHITIFDRSWYGRVLVERVEGFATAEQWSRAFGEIDEFERQLSDFGVVICKFWLHISDAEQLRRFEQREGTPYKAWKLTPDDWRNRSKWEQYYAAVEEMLHKTSPPNAPWTIVPSEDKLFGRIFVLKEVVRRLEKALGAAA